MHSLNQAVKYARWQHPAVDAGDLLLKCWNVMLLWIFPFLSCPNLSFLMNVNNLWHGDVSPMGGHFGVLTTTLTFLGSEPTENCQNGALFGIFKPNWQIPENAYRPMQRSKWLTRIWAVTLNLDNFMSRGWS